MQPTLQDIARETKTSVSTVSRVLAGGMTAARISKSTRKKILEASALLGYRPNLVARSLRTRKTNTIALLVSDIANPWFGQIASLIEQSLHRHGYSLILCNSGEDEAVEAEYLRLLGQRGIDGLIVVPLARSREKLLADLPDNLPLVVLDRPIDGISACVATDQQQLAGQLCDTLSRVGVRQVALVAGPSNVITHQWRAKIVAERFEVIEEHQGPAQRETGRSAMIRFTHRPQAIICTNNFLGQGVIDGIEAIENPPIIGCFDEIPMMHLLPLPIVCANQDELLLAEAAVNQLLAQLGGHAIESQAQTILPARIVTNRAFNEQFSPER